MPVEEFVLVTAALPFIINNPWEESPYDSDSLLENVGQFCMDNPGITILSSVGIGAAVYFTVGLELAVI